MLPETTIEKSGAAWTRADLDLLTNLYTETEGDVRAIAAKMGRSIASIWTKASVLGLSVSGPDVALRKCLGGCGRRFMSPHKGVRICMRCKCNSDLLWEAY